LIAFTDRRHILNAELTAIATFLGIMLGTAMSIVTARLIMDPRVKNLEDKLNVILDLLINGKPPPQ